MPSLLDLYPCLRETLDFSSTIILQTKGHKINKLFFGFLKNYYNF